MCMRLLPTEYLEVCGHQPWAFIPFLPKAQQGSSGPLGAPQFRGVISPKWPFSGWRMSLRVFFLKVMGSHSLQEPYAYVHVRWVGRHSGRELGKGELSAHSWALRKVRSGQGITLSLYTWLPGHSTLCFVTCNLPSRACLKTGNPQNGNGFL